MLNQNQKSAYKLISINTLFDKENPTLTSALFYVSLTGVHGAGEAKL